MSALAPGLLLGLAMPHRNLRFAIGFMLALAACSSTDEPPAPDSGQVLDAGTFFDAASIADAAIDADAGATADVGSPVDSGLDAGAPDVGPPPPAVPRAVEVARATSIPACTSFVDIGSSAAESGTAAAPYRTITAAVASANNGAIICVAEGTYAESLSPGEKYFTLAGGFQSNQLFAVRDSARWPSKAEGNGSGSFVRIEDPGPTEGQLTAIDGFEITGYSQGVLRDIYYSQRFDLTNNFIHDNLCSAPDLVGGGFSLNNVSGTISGNVIRNNTCSRGGGGALGDSTNSNTVSIIGNRVEGNLGNQPDISHGGGLYLFANALTVTANELVANRVTAWGGGLYIGAYTGGGQATTAVLSWNVYRDNRAENTGGGFFCDDSARCYSDHEIYERNCGGNILLDAGPDGSDPTIATFDHLTNYGALAVGCGAPGAGVIINKSNAAFDAYSFTNSIFWGNGTGLDFAAACDVGCGNITVDVTYSDVQTSYANDGVDIDFGAGILPAVDPLFVDAAGHDFHLRSSRGHWDPSGHVVDATDSPALGAGDPSADTADNPERAGPRTELGAYGNSVEASYVR